MLTDAISTQVEDPGIHGVRYLDQKVPEVKALINSPDIRKITEQLLKKDFKDIHLVRAIYFNKTAEKNWGVLWHQDKTIAVNQQLDIQGWGPWTVKDGVQHVEPPLEVLENMITLRLHLDPANTENGCLRVIPGSHKKGIVPVSEIQENLKPEDIIDCQVQAGDVVVMKPHIFHSSRKSLKPAHRRVIHLEYASYDLPDGLKWI